MRNDDEKGTVGNDCPFLLEKRPVYKIGIMLNNPHFQGVFLRAIFCNFGLKFKSLVSENSSRSFENDSGRDRREKVNGSYLFTLSSPNRQIFPPRLAELLYIDFDKMEAAFTETEENISRDMEITKISQQ